MARIGQFDLHAPFPIALLEHGMLEEFDEWVRRVFDDLESPMKYIRWMVERGKSILGQYYNGENITLMTAERIHHSPQIQQLQKLIIRWNVLFKVNW